MFLLLEENESRRFHFIKLLHYKNDWVKLSEIASVLSCSERSLKYDMAYFRKNTNIFTIESSTNGIRVIFADDKSFRCYSALALKQSLSYQLLEKIFFEEKHSVSALAELLFTSSSRLYNLINEINHQLIPYEMEIKTAPCRIVGNEKNIRKFFYTYFHEKYNVLNSSHKNELDHISEKFIIHIIDYFEFIHTSYSFINVIKLILKVNVNRYKYNHLLPNNIDPFKNNMISLYDLVHLQQVAKEIQLDLDPRKTYLPYEINISFLNNLLFPFNQVNIINSFDSLVAYGLENDAVAQEINFLNKNLEEVANKYGIPLNNKENVIYHLYNSVAMKKYDPRSNHILYSSNSFFSKNIENRFPHFFKDIKLLIKDYLYLKKLDYKPDNINFLIYILFIQWDQLYLHLKNRFKKINVIILSTCDISHSKMIKDMLESSFYSNLSIDYFSAPILKEDSLKILKNYDFVITNFPLNHKYSANLIQTENIPTIRDMEKIENKLYEVLAKRSYLS